MTLGLVYEWPVVMRTCMLGKSYSVQWGQFFFEVTIPLLFHPNFLKCLVRIEHWYDFVHMIFVSTLTIV